MKLIKAFIHQVRASAVIEALADAGFRNLTLHDVKCGSNVDRMGLN